MADDRHAAGRRALAEGVAGDEEAIEMVVKAHAAGAEEGDAGAARDPPQAVWQRVIDAWRRERPEDDRGRDAALRDREECSLQPLVADGEDGAVDRVGQLGQVGVAAHAVDRGPSGIHGVNPSGISGIEQLAEERVPEGAGRAAGADDRHRSGPQQRLERWRLWIRGISQRWGHRARRRARAGRGRGRR